MKFSRNTSKYSLTSLALFSVLILSFLVSSKQAFADVLAPGNISTCGEIAFEGTYTLTGNISTSSGACIIVTSGGVATSTIIDGQGLYTITGDVNGDGVYSSNPGHNFSLKNITVTGTTSSNGSATTTGSYSGNGGYIVVTNSTVATTTSKGASCPYYIAWCDGGNGGSIDFVNSNISSVQSVGGNGTHNAGEGGSVTISGVNVDLSNRNIDLSPGDQGTHPTYSGALTINYTTLNYTHLTLSNILTLTLNGPGNLPGNLGLFTAQTIPADYFSGGTITDISQCAALNLTGGVYTLGNDLTGDCHVKANGITINGAGHTITGNIVGDAGGYYADDEIGHSFSLQNITVTGTTSSNGAGAYGANGGLITVSSSTLNNISATAQYASNGGSVTLINSTTTGIINVNGGGYIYNGHAGSITITKPNIDLTLANFAVTGGSLTLNYSTLNHTDVTLPALASLTLNGPGNLPGNVGSFAGGVVKFIPGENLTSASDCAFLNVVGTYTLGNDLTGDCHITTNGVVIDGAGLYKINGAVVGNSTSYLNKGYNFTLQNITVTGTTSSNGLNTTGLNNNTDGGQITIINSTVATTTANGGINTATGSNIGNIQYANPGRNAGSILITNSTTTAVQANGGYIIPPGFSYPWFYSYDSGTGGSITITRSALNLSNGNISASGGMMPERSGTKALDGTVTFNYSTINYSNLTLSPLAHLIFNGPGGVPGDIGNYAGEVFSVIPSSFITNVSQCSMLSIPGTYSLANDITGDCYIIGDGIILDGANHVITGNVNGNGVSGPGHDFTLQNITVTGTTSSDGSLHRGGGSIVISTSTTNHLSAVGGGGFGSSPGSITISNSSIDLSLISLNLAFGRLTLNYNTVNFANVVLPTLLNLTMNGPGGLPGNLGYFAGGVIHFIPGQSISSASQCASLTIPGTYTLAGNITGDCHIVTSGIVIDGAHHTIIGNVIGDGAGPDTYVNGLDFTLENVTVSGTVSSRGAIITDHVTYPIQSGLGGNITIASSTVHNIDVSGDTDGSWGNSAGTITITGGVIDLSGTTLSAAGNFGGGLITISGDSVDLSNANVSADSGYLTINYGNTFNHTNLTLSVLADLIINGPGGLPGDLGFFEGGIFSNVIPGDTITDISQCSSLSIPGTYNLGANLSGDCHITGNDIIINGGGHTLTGNMIGDGIGSAGYNFTLQNITVTGTTSSNGAAGFNGGSIIVSTSTANHLSAVGGAGGVSGSITITNPNIDLTHVSLDIASGTLILNYSTLNRTGVMLPVLADLVLNGPGNLPGDLGAFAGGLISILLPGDSISTASQCASINIPGTYTLSGDLTGDCHIVANGIILDGASHTIDGDVIGDGVGLGSSGHNFTLENMTVTGTTSSNGVDYDPNFNHSNAGNAGSITILSSAVGLINANGGNGDIVNILPPGYGLSGSGGSITISTSTFGTIHAKGGENGFMHGGVGGSVTISDDNLNLSSKSIFAAGGGGIIYVGQIGHAESATSGVLILNYNTLSHTDLTLSALSGLTLNGPGNVPGYVGNFAGGVLGVIPNTVIIDPAQCATLTLAGRYMLGNNLTGDCRIKKDGIIIDGMGQYSIFGKVIGDGINPADSGFNFTLQNITVTDTISSNGLDAFNYSTRYPVGTIAGSGGTINIFNATTSDVYSNGYGGGYANTTGLGGSIIVASSTTGLLQAKGGAGSPYYQSAGNNGGSISVTNSITGIVETSGGNGIVGYIWGGNYIVGSKGGNAGPITALRSITDSLLAKGGDGSTNGGNGGVVSVSNSTAIGIGSIISANGGDSTICGYGGSGGSVSITNSSYSTSTITNNAGINGPSCPGSPWGPNTPHGSSGSAGSFIYSGQYNASSGYQAPNRTSISIVTPTPVLNPVAPQVSSASGGTSGSFISPIATTPVAPVTTPVSKPFFSGTFTEVASAAAQKVSEAATVVVNSPVSKTIQATGFFGGLVASVAFFAESSFATPIAASEVVLIPARLWGLVLMGLGIRRKSRPWGTVYDSVTKQPIDPAYITARDSTGRIVAEAVTDVDGRYGFLLPDGIYYISAKKTNYSFPSKKLDGRQTDELYNDLYFGEPVTVKDGQVIDKNIPLDQVNFDWNEQNKTQTTASNAPTFHTRHERPVAIISNYAYAIGLIISVVAVAMKPTAFNVLVLISYTLILLFLKWSAKPKRLGSVMDQNHKPMPYAIIRVTTPDKMVTLRSAVADAEGRYYCIVPKGEYVIEIQKKNVDGSYTKVYESPVQVGTSGIVSNNFVV